MNAERPIGLTKGPGETQHEFTFVSPDREDVLKVGEFVLHRAEIDGQERQVLSRVTARAPLRLYPDGFLAAPEIDPNDVAAVFGYGGTSHERFELTAAVIGYYDERLGDFINPRIPPRAGRPLYLAPDDLLASVLSKATAGEQGSAHIGSLLSRERGRVPLALDLRAVTSTHMAIIANTGAGKSYLAAVLLEELMKPNNRAAVLIVDPHGEYGTLAEMMGHEAFVEADYSPDVRVFRPGDVKVRTAGLTIGDLSYLLPNLSERMEYLLRRAHRDVTRDSLQEKGKPDRWTVAELQIRLRQLGEGGDSEDEAPDDRYAGTADALIWRLESVIKGAAIFDDFEHLDLAELFRPGRCSVLQLDEVDSRQQQIMVATLLRRAFRARTQTEKGAVGEDDELYLPYPVFILIEEAHHFAPAAADVVSTQVLKQVLSEGRKFGLAVGLISQRPGRLDPDALSQCNTQFLLRIVNPIDQARVAESVETVGRELLRELPALTKGQVIVAGEAVNTPVLCRVRSRHTPHGAESPDAPALWRKWFSGSGKRRKGARPAGKEKGDEALFK
ncbi:MAG: ATP-binding protein [Anaerolineales bacterium]